MTPRGGLVFACSGCLGHAFPLYLDVLVDGTVGRERDHSSIILSDSMINGFAVDSSYILVVLSS